MKKTSLMHPHFNRPRQSRGVISSAGQLNFAALDSETREKERFKKACQARRGDEMGAAFMAGCGHESFKIQVGSAVATGGPPRLPALLRGRLNEKHIFCQTNPSVPNWFNPSGLRTNVDRRYPAVGFDRRGLNRAQLPFALTMTGTLNHAPIRWGGTG